MPEFDALELKITKALSKLCAHPNARRWGNRDWTKHVKEAVRNVVEKNGFQWAATERGKNREWLWDGAAWEKGKGDLHGWVIKLPLVMESQWGGKDGVEDDFQRLMVARTDHRLLVYEAKTEAQAKEIIDDCKKGIAAFAQTERGDRYLFACWLNEQQTQSGGSGRFSIPTRQSRGFRTARTTVETQEWTQAPNYLRD